MTRSLCTTSCRPLRRLQQGLRGLRNSLPYHYRVSSHFLASTRVEEGSCCAYLAPTPRPCMIPLRPPRTCVVYTGSTRLRCIQS